MCYFRNTALTRLRIYGCLAKTPPKLDANSQLHCGWVQTKEKKIKETANAARQGYSCTVLTSKEDIQKMVCKK